MNSINGSIIKGMTEGSILGIKLSITFLSKLLNPEQ